MRNARITLAYATLAAIVLLATDRAAAQSFRRGGTEFNAVAIRDGSAGKPYAIVVTEFFHHGEIRPDGRNVLVVAQNKELVPMRILQLGPGDVCRLAFQTVTGQSEYDIFYGGDPPTETPPPWTCRDGLLLETRQFKQLRPQQPRFGAQRLRQAPRRSAPTTSTPSSRLQSVQPEARAVPEPLQRLPGHSQGGHLRVHCVEPGLQLPADRRQAGGLGAGPSRADRTAPIAAAATT